MSVFLPDFFFNISIITVTAPPISNNAPTDIPIISISGVSSLTSTAYKVSCLFHLRTTDHKLNISNVPAQLKNFLLLFSQLYV